MSTNKLHQPVVYLTPGSTAIAGAAENMENKQMLKSLPAVNYLCPDCIWPLTQPVGSQLQTLSVLWALPWDWPFEVSEFAKCKSLTWAFQSPPGTRLASCDQGNRSDWGYFSICACADDGWIFIRPPRRVAAALSAISHFIQTVISRTKQLTSSTSLFHYTPRPPNLPSLPILKCCINHLKSLVNMQPERKAAQHSAYLTAHCFRTSVD